MSGRSRCSTRPGSTIHLRRLVHYTGSDWRAMQPWVLLTNYHRYVDQFVQWGLNRLHADEGVEKVVMPGNVVVDRSLSRKEAEALAMSVAWHRFQMPAYHLVRSDGRGVSLVNIGVGPANAKNITDHIAVLRPHCWLMVGHCAGLRQSQLIGDYVLAHAYLRRDNILDDAVPLMMPIPAIAEVQVALQQAVAKVTGEQGDALKRRLRTGTVVTNDDRNWELRWSKERRLINISRAIAVDMESATVATQGFRMRVPYGTLAVRVRQAVARRDQAPRRSQRFLRAGDRRASADRSRRDRPFAEHRRFAALPQAEEFRRAAVPLSWANSGSFRWLQHQHGLPMWTRL